ncbi:MAG TPA: sigma-70 family RNA polymerase sigma factor [Pirellulaceae bacterium]|nr:sigma-70 family RNA polymerase sigma factor [Pirellulaceae bacterium]
MTTPAIPDTEELLRRAADGRGSAVEELFDRHRPRLRQMIAVWIDPRLSPRLDPSDVVQDTLVEAHGSLADFLRKRPLPFYPWLRQMAWNRLVDLHRRHLLAGRRSISREDPRGMAISDQSMERLSRKLTASHADPARRMIRKELAQRVRTALDRLPAAAREILVLRHMEQLSVKEIAVILGIAEGTAKSRHFRALEQLRHLLAGDRPGGAA